MNSKLLAKWVTASCKDRFYIQVTADSVWVTCSMMAVNIPAHELFTVKKALPVDVDLSKVGTHRIVNSKHDGEGVNIVFAIGGHLSGTSPAIDTTMRFDGGKESYSIVSTGNGFVAIKTLALSLFDGIPMFGNGGKKAIVFKVNGSPVGCVLPLLELPKGLTEFLKAS